jgi:hypothetical protein
MKRVGRIFLMTLSVAVLVTMLNSYSSAQEQNPSVEQLAKRLDELQEEVSKLKQERNNPEHDLLREGLKSGSTGVIGAFVLIGFIFLVNAVFDYRKDRVLFSPKYLIILSAIIAFSLITYFGGIFGYEIWARAKIKGQDFGAGSTRSEEKKD